MTWSIVLENNLSLMVVLAQQNLGLCEALLLALKDQHDRGFSILKQAL